MLETFISKKTIEKYHARQAEKPACVHSAAIEAIDRCLARPTCCGELRLALLSARELRLKWLRGASRACRQLSML